MWVFSPINITMSNCYFCTLDDLNDILKIHQSRFYIHNVEKPPAYYARFPTLIRSVLQGLKPDHKVIGYKPEGADHLVAYAIVWLPDNMPWNAIKLSEVIKSKESDIYLSMKAWCEIADEVARLGEADDKLQFFVACPLKMTMGLKRASELYKKDHNVMNNYNFLIFSMIGPDGVLKTPVDELMLSNYVLPKVQDIVIMNISMTEKCRLEHFKDRLEGFKNSDLSKFVMND